MQVKGQTPINTVQQGGLPSYTPPQVDPVQDPLSQLRDIHVPSEVNIWPLDWGWWVLLATVLFATFALIRWIVIQRRFNKPRKQALILLNDITSTQDNWPVALNALLKRTALTYCNDASIAGLHGKLWHAFLLDHVDKGKKDIEKGFELLSKNTYQQKTNIQDFTLCYRAVELWLKNAKLSHMNKISKENVEAGHA